MLDFKPVELEDRSLLSPYLEKYGENSCQHSFVSMYLLKEKYQDAWTIVQNTLFILRKERCDDRFRSYLFPLGTMDTAEAVALLREDAHSHGKLLRFATLSESAWQRLQACFPEDFQGEEVRDYGEYVYLTEKLKNMPGHKMHEKRRCVYRLWDHYGNDLDIHEIQENDLPDIWNFQQEWLAMAEDSHDMTDLERENRSIRLALDHYKEFQLLGIVVRLQHRVVGYMYGSLISPDCFDAIAQKGDYQLPGLYILMHMAMARHVEASGRKYYNMEEDLGISGLRRSKLSYRPDHLIYKYIAEEISHV